MFIILANQNNQNSNSIFGGEGLLVVLYLALTGYFLYRSFATIKANKNATGEVYKVTKQNNKMMSILVFLIAGLGIYNLIQGMILSGVLMLVLSIALTIESMTKNVIASNGFVADSKWIEWDQLKKWQIDKERGEVSVLYKSGIDEKTGFFRIKKEEASLIQDLFKKYKLKK